MDNKLCVSWNTEKVIKSFTTNIKNAKSAIYNEA